MHLIVDVLGYFTAATISGVAGTSSEGSTTTDFDLSGTCTQVVSCSITNNSTSSVGVVVIGDVSVDVNHTLGTHDEISATLSTTSATCDIYPVDPGTGWYDVNNAVPTGCCWQGHISVSKRFSLAAETTQTYFLNIRQNAGAPDVLDAGNIICLLDR